MKQYPQYIIPPFQACIQDPWLRVVESSCSEATQSSAHPFRLWTACTKSSPLHTFSLVPHNHCFLSFVMPYLCLHGAHYSTIYTLLANFYSLLSSVFSISATPACSCVSVTFVFSFLFFSIFVSIFFLSLTSYLEMHVAISEFILVVYSIQSMMAKYVRSFSIYLAEIRVHTGC